jgi:hypothetical protein
MLISEQKYTNKNRIYYRGLKAKDLSKKGFEEIYLTTDIVYALSYAGINGLIEVYRLKDTSNIFNMRSKTDEANLKKFCQSHYQQYGNYLKYLEALKNNDWSNLVGGALNRQPIIIAIKSLGYDGYFNYEIDNDFFQNTKDYFWNIYNKPHVNFPAVAIFNNDAIEKIDTLTTAKILQNEKIKKINLQEKKFALCSKVKGRDFIKKNTLTLTNDEIDNILNCGKNLSEEQVNNFYEILRWDIGY